MSEDCDFCDIARGRSSAEILVETADNLAFIPLNPATPGHTLLVPRHHIADVWALNAHASASLARDMIPIVKGVRRVLDPEGLNIISSSGEAAEQTVMHLHIHILPRWKDDAMPPLWPQRHESPKAMDLQQVLELKQAIRDITS